MSPEVVYDAEHFFDGYKANPEYALKTLQAAEQARGRLHRTLRHQRRHMPFEVAAISPR
jgi:2-isopropylmalate synthase